METMIQNYSKRNKFDKEDKIQGNRKSCIEVDAKKLVKKSSLDDISVESKCECGRILSVERNKEGNSGLKENNSKMKVQIDVSEIRLNSEKNTDINSSLDDLSVDSKTLFDIIVSVIKDEEGDSSLNLESRKRKEQYDRKEIS